MNVPGVIVLTLSLAACQAQPANPTAAPANREVARQLHYSGYFGGRKEFAVVPLRDRAAWESFWRGVQRMPPQSLDPSREMAIAVFLGERRTGGYGIEIVRVHPAGQKLVVEYRETTPEPGTMTIQALTTPWTVAVVPRSDLPLEPRKISSGQRPQRK